jgi:PTS system mannose-specific IIA component
VLRSRVRLFFGNKEVIIQNTMPTGILIVAHQPLASALRACVLHVFPDAGAMVQAVDVAPLDAPEASLARAFSVLRSMGQEQTLVLADVFGATPCNVAQRLLDGQRTKLVAGVNLPMLLRTVNYCHESLDQLVTRAVAGGTQGVMQVASSAPQNQSRVAHDYRNNDYQQ